MSERLVVVSPHLDDGVFSLGATLARASRSGTDVRVVTVMAGSPQSTSLAGWWDRATGFSSLGEAARARRLEDLQACEIVGATPVWLPFSDATYGTPPDPELIWDSLAATVDGAEAVLVPGFPLEHPDHLWLTRLVLERGFHGARLGLYVEQPYAWRAHQRRKARPAVLDEMRPLVNGSVRWLHVRGSRSDRRAKLRASRAYASQFCMFGRFPLRRIALYEALRGGETLAWLD